MTDLRVLKHLRSFNELIMNNGPLLYPSLPPAPGSHLATLCSWIVHLLAALNICGGAGAEGWSPVPFDGPSAK